MNFKVIDNVAGYSRGRFFSGNPVILNGQLVGIIDRIFFHRKNESLQVIDVRHYSDWISETTGIPNSCPSYFNIQSRVLLPIFLSLLIKKIYA